MSQTLDFVFLYLYFLYFFMFLFNFLFFIKFFMWGAISNDFIYQQNFNIGFSTLKSDNLIHLTQWQYWWWFWFSFIWVLYFIFVNKLIKLRVLKMRPKIATSFRSHGKWGDYLACIVPAIWCFNILVNSSFILRLMEWQNESSLFAVRVRGRQWYWIYKFDLKTAVDLVNVPKNVGYNRWVINTAGSYEVVDNYFYALKLRSYNNTLKNYWNTYLADLEKTGELTNFSFLSSNLLVSNNFLKKNFDNLSLSHNSSNLDLKIKPFNSFWSFEFLTDTKHTLLDSLTFSKLSWITRASFSFKNMDTFKFSNGFLFLNILNLDQLKYKKYSLIRNFFSKNIFLEKSKQLVVFNGVNSFLFEKFKNNQENFINISQATSEVFDNSRFLKRKIIESQPILITKSFLNPSNNNKIITSNSKDLTLLNIFFNKDKTIEKKNLVDQAHLVIKQKRYKRKKNIPLRQVYTKSLNSDNKKGKIKFSDRPYLTANRVFSSLNLSSTKLYRTLRKNKIRHENISIQFSRRLLRTKKTLVLPAHVNLTIISNSYDVVHSWFIPSMGIKIDCVPGRATHHSFYCDSVGFFYGQCAEICGRYHHHMPIRLCSLPFDQFLVWWHHFGLPKLLFTKSKHRFDVGYGQKTFFW